MLFSLPLKIYIYLHDNPAAKSAKVNGPAAPEGVVELAQHSSYLLTLFPSHRAAVSVRAKEAPTQAEEGPAEGTGCQSRRGKDQGTQTSRKGSGWRGKEIWREGTQIWPCKTFTGQQTFEAFLLNFIHIPMPVLPYFMFSFHVPVPSYFVFIPSYTYSSVLCILSFPYIIPCSHSHVSRLTNHWKRQSNSWSLSRAWLRDTRQHTLWPTRSTPEGGGFSSCYRPWRDSMPLTQRMVNSIGY